MSHCWFTWVLYQCATVTPDAFSPGEPLESGPNETKINAAATKPINHNQRFTLESFILPSLLLSVGRTSRSVASVTPRETLARTLHQQLWTFSVPKGRALAPMPGWGASTPAPHG